MDCTKAAPLPVYGLSGFTMLKTLLRIFNVRRELPANQRNHATPMKSAVPTAQQVQVKRSPTAPVDSQKLPPPGKEPAVPVFGPVIMPQQDKPPSLAEIKPVVSTIAPHLAARFWEESLAFLDISSLAARGDKEVKPLEQLDISSVPGKGAVSADADGQHAKAVFVALMLWEVDRHGSVDPNGMRYPIGVVSAKRDGDGLLFPDLSLPPRMNEKYLEPGVKAEDLNIAERAKVDALLQEAWAAMTADPLNIPGWRLVWDTFLSVVMQACSTTSLPELEARLSTLAYGASRKRRQYCTWQLCVAVYEGTGGGTGEISRLYKSLAHGMGAYPEETALFQQLCKAAPAQSVTNMPDELRNMVIGHIDEYEGGERALFPLDLSQRTAARAILSLKPGEMQAINGPPGSGKTSMLRAVVGSMWVYAAWKQQPCPIIVACGATNQSVTNVIGAFGNAPHGDDRFPVGRRWLPGIGSYGAYFPSNSVKADEEKKEELEKLWCLQYSNKGMLFEYWNRDAILSPSRCLDLEKTYLRNACVALPGEELKTVEDTVRYLWQRLDACCRSGLAFLQAAGNAAQLQELGQQFLASTLTDCWTKARLEQARKRLEALASAPDNLLAAHEFADLTWRSLAFHLAARYWEGMFVLSQRERLLSRHPNNVEAALRRLCMLTPCLVSTMHMAPKFARIHEEVNGHATQRNHAFGLLDLLVVDEAGQAMPDLGAACFALAKRAAVVGDLKQLAPITALSLLGEAALARRVGISDALDGMVLAQRSPASGSVLGMARLVSRWHEQDDTGITLRFHYRCVPDIVGYCKQLCYPDLRFAIGPDPKFPLPPMSWVEVVANGDRSGGSRRNTVEANEVIEWIVDQWPQWRVHAAFAGKPIQDIVAIITPYAAQSRYFTEHLAKAITKQRQREPANWPSETDVKKIVIGTVHRLQGAERPIVCFSLVEGPEQNTGSFVDRDNSMLNVAVSRAKKSFIMFAHPERLFYGVGRESSSGKENPSHVLGRYLKEYGRRLYPSRLVIIEATGKLRALSSILGKDAVVMATQGALHDLPLADGVDIGAGLVPRPVLRTGAQEALARLAQQARAVDEVVIATDDDRMGEYIAWQVIRGLGDSLAGKKVNRVRLAAITPKAVRQAFEQADTLHPNAVIAEVTREVADNLITRSMARIKDLRIVPKQQKLFHDIGALTSATEPGYPRPVGRVQAAVLRILLDEARKVAADFSLRRIRVTATIADVILTGVVFQKKEGEPRRTTTSALNAEMAQENFAKAKLGAKPRVMTSVTPMTIAGPGTAALLAQCATRFDLPPWVTMQSLQALYDGSWAAKPVFDDPVSPVHQSHLKGGHPPIHPLDRNATPDALSPSMSKTDWRVYSLVWDYMAAGESQDLYESLIQVECMFENNPSLGVYFEALSCEGLPESLQHVAFPRSRQATQSFSDLDRVAAQLSTAQLRFEPIAAVHWDFDAAALLWMMADMRIGRPSTYARALENLANKGLIDFPARGALRLTPHGLATALLLEQEFLELSDPVYSNKLFAGIDEIEAGRSTPAAVLGDLLQALGPDVVADTDLATVKARIRNTLSELEQALEPARRNDPAAAAGALIAGEVPALTEDVVS